MRENQVKSQSGFVSFAGFGRGGVLQNKSHRKSATFRIAYTPTAKTCEICETSNP
jgi:hypothetical protein